jgi:hypothetical protein
MDLAPVDFLSGLGGINNLPDPAREQAIATGLQTSQLQRDAASLQLQQAQSAQQRQQAGQAALMQLGDDPTPQATAAFMRQYPEYAQAIKSAHDIQDEGKRDSDFRVQSQIYSAAAGGKYDLAAQLLQAHHDASVKAGEPEDPTDVAIITALKSGDPAEQKRALSMIGLSVAAINPEKFNETYKVLDGNEGSTVINAGGALVDKRTGKVLFQADNAPKYMTVKNADGSESIVQVGSEGGGPASGGGASSGALSVRLNNPGAIRFDAKNDWQGQVGSENGFVKFDTPANGQRAHQKLIANQIKSGFDTPLEWAQHYAPKEDGNDPAAYAATIAKGLGIGVGDKIPLSAVPKMAALSAQVEAGGTPAPQGGASGTKVLYTSQGAGNASAPGDASLTGDAYLATIPKPLAAQVKALAEGRLAIPTGAALRSPQVQQLWAAAAQYDPDLDQANAKTRYATRKEFTSGKAAANITSFNTALHHIDTLAHAADDLNNGSFPLFNTIGNAASKATGGPAVDKFNAAKQAVVDELERAFRGTSGTLAGIKGWESAINSSSSPAQIHGVLTQMADLLAGRIEALGEQYTQGMGRSVDGVNLLDSKARATLKRFGSGYGDTKQVADGTAATRTATNPKTGQRIGLVNGKWVPLQ